MSAVDVAQGHCAWCAMPRARQGLIVGLMGSFLLHAVALGAVAHLGNSEPQTKKQARVIYLGEITIAAPKKQSVSSTAKEI